MCAIALSISRSCKTCQVYSIRRCEACGELGGFLQVLGAWQVRPDDSSERHDMFINRYSATNKRNKKLQDPLVMMVLWRCYQG